MAVIDVVGTPKADNGRAGGVRKKVQAKLDADDKVRKQKIR